MGKESMSETQTAVLAEFEALRAEMLQAINARLWGAITYVGIIAALAAAYQATPRAEFLLLAVFFALPLLWHTIHRERSRIRIGSFIKIVLEPRSGGLRWERYLGRWRQRFPAESKVYQVSDKWVHILSLTGVCSLERPLRSS